MRACFYNVIRAVNVWVHVRPWHAKRLRQQAYMLLVPLLLLTIDTVWRGVVHNDEVGVLL